MKRVIVHLDFLAPDDIDPAIFGERVLDAIERSPAFATEPDGTLRLVAEGDKWTWQAVVERGERMTIDAPPGDGMGKA
jgi:hypothetical protein